MRVLVVEDDRRIAADISRALQGGGYVAETVQDGEEAWFRGDTEDYGAIILDLGLPKMDGLAVLKRWRANEEQFNKAIDLIMRSSKRGAELTDSLLTFTQVSSKERCESAADAAKAAITMLPFVSRSDVTFVLEIDESLPPVRIPSADLSQVFVELLRNSVEAIGESGTVYVRAERCLESVVFEVEDTGRGMAPETADHLFEPFYSTKNLDSMLGIALDGSGLGLTSVYNLVSGAGGEIAVGKTSPNGTMISFSVPIAADSDR